MHRITYLFRLDLQLALRAADVLARCTHAARFAAATAMPEYLAVDMRAVEASRWRRGGAPTAAFAAAAATAQKEKKKEKKKNPLLEAYGANALKSLARSHPEIMARHHPDLVVGEDGAVARRTSARAYRE